MKSWITRVLVLAMVMVSIASFAAAQQPQPTPHPTETRTEANLVLPDLRSVSFLGVSGQNQLLAALVVWCSGLMF